MFSSSEVWSGTTHRSESLDQWWDGPTGRRLGDSFNVVGWPCSFRTGMLSLDLRSPICMHVQSHLEVNSIYQKLSSEGTKSAPSNRRLLSFGGPQGRVIKAEALGQSLREMGKFRSRITSLY